MLWTTSDVWCDVCGENASSDVGRRTKRQARAIATREGFRRMRGLLDGAPFVFDVCASCSNYEKQAVADVLEGRSRGATR